MSNENLFQDKSDDWEFGVGVWVRVRVGQKNHAFSPASFRTTHLIWSSTNQWREKKNFTHLSSSLSRVIRHLSWEGVRVMFILVTFVNGHVEMDDVSKIDLLYSRMSEVRKKLQSFWGIEVQMSNVLFHRLEIRSTVMIKFEMCVLRLRLHHWSVSSAWSFDLREVSMSLVSERGILWTLTKCFLVRIGSTWSQKWNDREMSLFNSNRR